jgi:hypothetical protein
MDRQEIMDAIIAIPEGKADVIKGRAVLKEHGFILIEGFRNKPFAWNVAIDKLCKLR